MRDITMESLLQVWYAGDKYLLQTLIGYRNVDIVSVVADWLHEVVSTDEYPKTFITDMIQILSDECVNEDSSRFSKATYVELLIYEQSAKVRAEAITKETNFAATTWDEFI